MIKKGQLLNETNLNAAFMSKTEDNSTLGSITTPDYIAASDFRNNVSGTSTKIKGGDGASAHIANYVEILPYSSAIGLLIREDSATVKWANIQVDSIARPDKLFIGYMQNGAATTSTGIDIDTSGNLVTSGDILIAGGKLIFGYGSTMDNETDGTLKVKGDGSVQIYGTSSATSCLYIDGGMFGCKLDSETYARTIFNLADGKIGFGPGTTSRDTFLYRDAVGSLKTDGLFTAESANYPVIRGTRSITDATGRQVALEALLKTSADMGANFGPCVDFSIQDSSGFITNIGEIGAIREDVDNYGALVFSTSKVMLLERMRITSMGNVGIGVTDPGAYKLNVNGPTNITGDLNVTGKVTATSFSGRWRKTKTLTAPIAQGVRTALTGIDATWTNTWDITNNHIMVIVDGEVNAPSIDYNATLTNSIAFTYDVPSGSVLDIIVW
jgi:hypothetical protein